MFDRVEHDARFRLDLAVARLDLAEQTLEIVHRCGVDLEDEHIAPGDGVAFDYLGVSVDEFLYARAGADIVFVAGAQLHKGAHVKPDLSGVEYNAVLFDDARCFKLLDPVDDRGYRHARLFADSGRADARVLLQARNYFKVLVVDPDSRIAHLFLLCRFLRTVKMILPQIFQKVKSFLYNNIEKNENLW